MAESALKRLIQKLVGLTGYKLVQLKAYERRNAGVRAQAATGPKVFGIGYNKTGSTTLEALFRHYGLRAPKQLDQERLLAGLPFNGDFNRLQGFIRDYDAFQDFPFSQFETYIACDVLFPGSKFILTLRDPEAWFNSYARYYKAAYGFADDAVLTEQSFLDKDLYLFRNYVHAMMRQTVMTVQNNQAVPDWSLVYDPVYFKALYQSRNQAIIRYFSGRPDALLVIDLTLEKDTRKIVEFLGLTDSSIIAMPHLNQR